MSSTPPANPSVLMFHIGRSGSRVLGDLLGQHPQLHWDHEAYVAQLQAARKSGRKRPQGEALPLLLERRRAAPPDSIFGSEVKFFHLRLYEQQLDNFVTQLHAADFRRFILLERRNYLRKIVSSLIAKSSGQWHFRNKSPQKPAPVFIDVDAVAIDWTVLPLLTHLERFRDDFTQAAAVLRPYPLLNLTYETDIAADPTIAFSKACRFLNLEPHPAIVHYQRANPYPLTDLIVNVDQVAKRLRHTPFAWMLSEDELH
jgi:LPS sulfotransferase NodH